MKNNWLKISACIRKPKSKVILKNFNSPKNFNHSWILFTLDCRLSDAVIVSAWDAKTAVSSVSVTIVVSLESPGMQCQSWTQNTSLWDIRVNIVNRMKICLFIAQLRKEMSVVHVKSYFNCWLVFSRLEIHKSMCFWHYYLYCCRLCVKDRQYNFPIMALYHLIGSGYRLFTIYCI